MKMKLWLLGWLLASSLPAAEIYSKAQALIERTGKFYDSAQTLKVEIESEMFFESEAASGKLKDAETLAVSRPGRVAYVRTGGSLTGSLTTDGASKTVFFAPLKKYTVTKIENTEDAEFGMRELFLLSGLVFKPSVFFNGGVTEALTPKDGKADAQLAGDEEIGGVQCRHLRLDFSEKKINYTLDVWIQKDGDPLIVKAVENMLTKSDGKVIKYESVFANWRVNEPVPDDAFVFTPPPDAQKVDELFQVKSPEEKTPHPLAGQPAPDFILEDLHGKKISLSALRGKVVVLDFWATWCPPCVEGLPKIWSVMRAHPDAVFYAVNVRESAETIDKFLSKKQLDALPVLRDTDGKISNDYQAKAIPQTVFINKDGVIASVHVGLAVAELEKELAR
jgi:peroxiredoxin